MAMETTIIPQDVKVDDSTIERDSSSELRVKDGGISYAKLGSDIFHLGEVRMFALSETGAITKATLQGRGWAICDGTTPATQGIADADISGATPNLQEKFIRMSNDETSGGTGGSNTEVHNHKWYGYTDTGNEWHPANEITAGDTHHSFDSDGNPVDVDYNFWHEANSNAYDRYTNNHTVNTVPPYFELAFFIKVKA